METETTNDAPTGVFQEGTTAFNGNVLDHVSAETRKELGDTKYFDTFKDFDGLVKSAHGLSKLAGRALVPGKDAAPEDWDKVLDTAPRPEKPDGYGFTLDSVEDQGLKAKLEGMDWLAKASADLHASGVPTGIARKLFTQSIQRLQLEQAAIDNAKKEGNEALDRAWGSDAPANRALAMTTNDTFMSKPFVELMQKAGLSDHPAVVEQIYQIGKRVATRTHLTSGGQPGKADGGQSATPLVDALGLAQG